MTNNSSETMKDFFKIMCKEVSKKSKIIMVKPSLYSVILIDDDFTTQDFAIDILIKLFHKSDKDAIKTVFKIQDNGRSVVGVYTRDVAETKVMLVIDEARENSFPLKCILNKV